MDLRLREIPAKPEEQAAVDAVLGPPESGWTGGRRDIAKDGRKARGGHALRAQRHLLLPTLHAVQDRMGWISPEALNYICQRLDIPPAEAYGVASFYALFSLTPQPPVAVHVCDDIACLANGAAQVCVELEQRLGPAGSANKNGQAAWHRSPCLGLCDRAPAALVLTAGSTAEGRALAPTRAAEIVNAVQDKFHPEARQIAIPQGGDPRLHLLRRVGVADPTNLDSYRSHGGYAALRRAIELGPEGVIREVNDSKLLGRGGAAFPMGRKWEAVARAAARPHYLVCNADESEPGTFKDRVVMEGDPFALLEAMTIAGFATNCEHGYIYIRGEYPLAARRLQNAIAQARARGLLGENVMGRGFRFDIELRRGAGAYICGEETALLNSIEGYRGEPRNKPPFPVQHGLFGKPTVINNVETLVNVLDIVLQGGPAFAATGTSGSTGTKLFCVSGCVTHPGVYEVEFGITLRQLLALAGGVRNQRSLQTVLLGGAAGVFMTPDQLDTPLTFEGVRAIGATLGSGVVMVFDDAIDIKAILRRIAAFFRDESCGQCVPCRVGTVRQEEWLQRMHSQHLLGSLQNELTLRAEISQVMRDASICGLGQTAASAIESALTKLKIF
ncbi:MAG TPA: NAD(P)H-dependent oxidoreductase subunit E [Methylomirabilota bacterium]|nr:NAD(P)H-dependent oxidoreductase subunit E [Methylomirabilota bacterium]